MERTILLKMSLILAVFHWIPQSILFLILVCDCFGALSTNKPLLLPDGGSAELPIGSPQDTEEGTVPHDVAPGWNLTHRGTTHTGIPGSLPANHKTHAAPIRERSAKDESCQLLKEIQNDSLKGFPTIDLGIISNKLIVIQNYPTSALLRYLCEDRALSPNTANFTSAMSLCPLLNITTISDNVTDMEIKEPSWINYENLDRSEILWKTIDLEEGTCFTLDPGNKETYETGLDELTDVTLILEQWARFRSLTPN